MLTDPRTAARVAAAQRQQRAAAHDDIEMLDALLAEAHRFKASVGAAAPYLAVARARAALDDFADRFDDLMGDTVAAARKFADDALDDASPYARPGRAA